MPQQYANADPVLRPLVMLVAVILWAGIYAILTRLISRPASRFRLHACGAAALGFSFEIGWMVQFLVFGAPSYTAAQRMAAEHFTLTLGVICGAVLTCAGLALGAWARVEDRSLLVALVRPPGSVGDRSLGPKAILALFLLGEGTGLLAFGFPLALGYV